MDTLTRFIVPVVFFLLTAASGVWLSRSGKPLNSAIITVHKLIALGALIATAIQTYHALKGAQIQAGLIVLLVVAAVSVVALFVTGALMSMDKPAYGMLLTIHNIALFLAAIAVALAAYLMVGGT
jgi:hypothetical protein